MRGVSPERTAEMMARRGGRPLSVVVREILTRHPGMDLPGRLEAANRQRATGEGTKHADDYTRQINSETHRRRKEEAEAVGLTVGTFNSAAAVVRAAEANPERYGFVLEVLDTQTVNQAMRELRRAKAAPRGERAPETIVQNATSMLNEATSALASVKFQSLDPVVAGDLRGELNRAVKRLREEMWAGWQTK